VKGLLLRLSALDPDAAAAARVIGHFVALLDAGPVEPAVLVRSTAGLAECPAGLDPGDGRPVVRYGADGAPLTGPAGAISGRAALGTSGRVWLERAGGPGPLDELVLEWMAIAARTAPRPGALPAAARYVADPALVELVLSEREAAQDRARALRLLGLGTETPLRVAAVAAVAAEEHPPDRGGPPARHAGAAGVRAVSLLGRSGLPAAVRVAGVGPLGVALVQPVPGGGATPGAAAGEPAGPAPEPGSGPAPGSPAAALRAALAGPRARTAPAAAGEDAVRLGAIRVGVGGAVEPLRAAESWAQARSALRFTVPGDPVDAVADHAELGAAALLAEVPAERLRARPEVAALDALAATEGGAACLAALAAVCRTGSLRRAAAELHLHHSSVADRLAQVERALGHRLTGPQDRTRAQLALYAHRLARTGP
jgi:hypothetical protein